VPFIGVDLAWAEGSGTRLANETGLAAIAEAGQVIEAGWTRGLDRTLEWITSTAGSAEDVLVAVDAPLVVTNREKQRACEKQVGQRYGAWKVSANSTNLSSPRLAGVELLAQLEWAGFTYANGWAGSPAGGRHVFECYPYTTLVGVAELGYDDERPRYKRKPAAVAAAEWRPLRARECDKLLRHLSRLAMADPPLDLRSHPASAELLEQLSPSADAAYKHREDLIDALISAWTASFWHRHGLDRCQVLGERTGNGPAATIIAPARPEQRRDDPEPSEPVG